MRDYERLAATLRLRFSWLVLAAGLAVGALVADGPTFAADRLRAALLAGYLLWGAYWGIPATLRLWWRWTAGLSRGARMMTALPGCFAVPCLGDLYGLLGGGIYECISLWRRISL